MKKKISITVEEKLMKKIEKELKQGLFRNKSHVIEYAITQFLKNGQEKA
ncbi:ribbon-helix-helix domain-containing protein [Candidatus Woesearchaeota archaeon]|nr:ribbon-helix-helix domain-containing protein [Candidatus Woesearchaeota archaeon]